MSRAADRRDVKVPQRSCSVTIEKPTSVARLFAATIITVDVGGDDVLAGAQSVGRR
jgi:hypothetical protein